MRARTLISTTILASLALAAGGCYEDTGAAPPQAQAPAPPPKEGPLTSMATGNGPASSALGKAKRTAGNIADQAQQKSREVADQADDMMNPKPRPNEPQDPAADPASNPGGG